MSKQFGCVKHLFAQKLINYVSGLTIFLILTIVYRQWLSTGNLSEYNHQHAFIIL